MLWNGFLVLCQKVQGAEHYSRRWRSAADFDRPCVATRSDGVWLFEVSGGSPQAPVVRQSLGLHPSEVEWSQKKIHTLISYFLRD